MKQGSIIQWVLAGLVGCGLAACTPYVTEAEPAVFAHGVDAASKPWTSSDFDAAEDRFTFAVFSDLTGGERAGIFEIAVEQLNLLRPELIVNVGDLTEGGNDPEELNGQWDSFDRRARKAQAPVFYTGGNHDLLGVEMRRTWENRLGPRYYHFIFKNVLFLVLDTEDYPPARLEEVAAMRDAANEVAKTQGWAAHARTPYAQMPEDETGFISQVQSQAMLRAIRANPNVRWTFLLMHKAPWMADDMPAWNAIEQALADRPYTVFHGHRHAYRYENRGGHDYIRLATTGGVPLPKNGRSMDQLVLVTVDGDGAHIANLLMSGILDKTGHIPLGGDEVCFESVKCEDAPD